MGRAVRRIVLVAETPNAADGTHRYLASPDHGLEQHQIERWMQEARYQPVGKDYVAVSRRVVQEKTGRPAADLLLLVGVDTDQLRRSKRLEPIRATLGEYVAKLPGVVQEIDWRKEGSIAETETFGRWLLDPPIARRPRRQRAAIRPLLVVLSSAALVALALSRLGPNRWDEPGEHLARSSTGRTDSNDRAVPGEAPSNKAATPTSPLLIQRPGDVRTGENAAQANRSAEPQRSSLTENLRRRPSPDEPTRSEETLREAEDAKLRRDYEGLMNGGSLARAAHLLLSGLGSPALVEALRQDFESRVLVLGRKLVSSSEVRGDWLEAYRWIAELESLPIELRPDSLSREVMVLRGRVESRHDRALYQAARQHRTRKALRDYLREAPRQSMRPRVEQYLQYLELVETPLHLSLVLYAIDWDPNCSGEQNVRIAAWVQDQDQQAFEKSGISLRNCGTERSLGTHPLQAKVSDELQIRLRMTRADATFVAEAIETRAVRDWHVHRLELKASDGRTHHATFRIHKLPSEPELPPVEPRPIQWP